MCSYISRCLNVLYLKCLRNVLQILGAQSSQGTASRSCKVYFTKFFLFPRYSFIGCRSLSESPVHFRKSRRDHEFFMSSMDFRKYLEFGFNHDCIFHHRMCNWAFQFVDVPDDSDNLHKSGCGFHSHSHPHPRLTPCCCFHCCAPRRQHNPPI